ncbi:MAG TPA: DNA methyltransferase [Symbiobacteriaceae bacterium]|jgi:site-specific DNA-methyltransferase (adenine-specific)
MDIMPTLPPESFDSLVTDPPAGVSFMGKAWDSHSKYVPKSEKGRAVLESLQVLALEPWEAGFVAFTADWATEALRLLKPGAYGVVWALPRTADLTGLGLRAAGFEIRNSIQHLFGSGFPKSLDVSKAIDFMLFTEWLMEHRPKAIRWAKRLWTSVPKDRWAWKWCVIATTVWGPPVGKRFVIGFREQRNPYIGSDGLQFQSAPDYAGQQEAITAPGSPEAAKWEGFGTDIKPSQEQWLLVRKPPSEDTVAENLLKHGVGALNIDGCRIKTQPGESLDGGRTSSDSDGWDRPWKHDEEAMEAANERIGRNVAKAESLGRFPANLVLTHHADCRRAGTKTVKGGSGWAQTGGSTSKGGILNPDQPIGTRKWDGDRADENGMETVEAWECAGGCPVLELDRQSGQSASRKGQPRASAQPGNGYGMTHTGAEYEDQGGASRFFPQFAWEPEDIQTAIFLYAAKASRSERNRGCEALEEKPLNWSSGEANPGTFQAEGTKRAARNFHPTIKSVGLMRWLVRLVTPPGGKPLDPFGGSGTTAKAAEAEGFDCTLIERDPDYVRIAKARVGADIEQPKFNFG